MSSSLSVSRSTTRNPTKIDASPHTSSLQSAGQKVTHEPTRNLVVKISCHFVDRLVLVAAWPRCKQIGDSLAFHRANLQTLFKRRKQVSQGIAERCLKTQEFLKVFDINKSLGEVRGTRELFRTLYS